MSTTMEATSSLGTWATLRRGFELSPELRRGLGVTLALAAVTTVGRVVVPLVVQQTTDHGLLGKQGPDPALVWRYVGLAVIAVVVTATTAYAVNVRLFRASEAGLATLRLKGFRHIHDLSMLTQNTERRGSMVGRVTSRRRHHQPVRAVRRHHPDPEPRADRGGEWADALLQPAAHRGRLALLRAGAVRRPALPDASWAVPTPLCGERVGDLLAAVSEAVVGAATIRAYGVEERTGERIDEAIEAHRRAAIGAQVRSVVAFSSGQLVAGLTLAVVLVVGTVQAAGGHLTIGELLAFTFLVNLFTQPVQQATEILNDLQNAVAGWRRVIGVIDTPADVADPGRRRRRCCRAGRSPWTSTGCRSPTPAAETVLHDVTLSIAPRSRIAIVGETGSGKSTMAKLLTRLMDPTEGVVRIDGVDLRQRAVLLAARARGDGAPGGLPVRRDAAGERPVRPARARPTRTSSWP